MSFVKKRLNRLRCKHENQTLVKKGNWQQTLQSTNSPNMEEERPLVFTCDNCNKQIIRKQIRIGLGSTASLINYKDID